MGWRIVKQPHRLYAEFSEVVDNFVAVNMTLGEAVDRCAGKGMGELEALEKVRAGVVDRCPWRGDEDLTRWEDALNTIRLVHGAEKLAATLEEIATDLQSRAGRSSE